MKQFSVLCWLVFSGACLFAQTEEETDSLTQDPAFQVHMMPYLQWNEVFGRLMPYGAAEGEIIYRERIAFGIFGEYMLGTFLRRVVFPETYEFSNYKYGLSAGYNFPVTESFWLLSRLKVSQQRVKWIEQEGESFAISDQCLEFRPMVGFRGFFLKNIFAGGSVGYNFAEGLEMSGVEQKDMNGIVLSVNIGVRF